MVPAKGSHSTPATRRYQDGRVASILTQPSQKIGAQIGTGVFRHCADIRRSLLVAGLGGRTAAERDQVGQRIEAIK
jgi:hypothetical protein